MSFFFCTLAPETTAAARADLARSQPEWRPAFARPGLLTFRTPEPVAPDIPAPTPFARVWGRSVGSFERVEQISEALGAELGGAKAVLHVWPRELSAEGGSDLAASPEWQAQIKATEAELSKDGRRARAARPGELVLDVVLPPLGSTEKVFVGLHRHQAGRSGHAGGALPVTLPVDTPSRAGAKIAEAILWTGARVLPGDHVLELGCSPGGATRVLLDMGCMVCGVDPEPLSDVVARHPNLHHHACAVGAFPRSSLREQTDWLIMDMSVAAPVALRSIQRFFPPLRPHLRGAFLTLKLNDWGLAADLPRWKEALRSHGFEDVRATHLPSNRQELLLFGATPRFRAGR
jgi:23S rRNA (cytidine2498-2'-O)-methyltransferase